MDTLGLHSASDYLNNLLLARGLLRNGSRIDFAELEEGADETRTQIINLVHDLVTRRDREAEQRESLATTIRSLRKTEAKQALQIEQLETKTEDLSRSIALAEGQETAFKATIKNADTTIRGLKEQMQRMKSSIQQIRGQCATDIRKRDLELQKLKTHLTDRQRGKRDGLGVMTITIQPPPNLPPARRTLEGSSNVGSPGCSLKQETSQFLTQLCQNLSEENEVLIQLSRSTIQTLKELQGLTDEHGEEMEGIADGKESVDGTLSQRELLVKETSTTLEQLRALLTNPSFVPLEEVEIRDAEIIRLREGWEKMESRWQEAISMMDGWHKRVSHGSNSVNLDELRLGASFTSDSSAHRNSTANTSIDPLTASGSSVPPPRERTKRLFDMQSSGPGHDEAPLQDLSGNERPIFPCEGSFDEPAGQAKRVPAEEQARQKRQKLSKQQTDSTANKEPASKHATLTQDEQEESRKAAQSKKRTAPRPRKRSSLNKEQLQSLLRAKRLANKGHTRIRP